MITSNYAHDTNNPLNSDFESFFPQGSVQNCQNQNFDEEVTFKQEKSFDHVDDGKQTMQTICSSFIHKYQNSSKVFQPINLAIQLNAKQRRIYDLTNILEGCGIIQKVEKSCYVWKGQTNSCKRFSFDKSDWCSLRNISSQLKRLFQTIRKGLTCRDLYQILVAKKQNKFNPATIRRRIYQCCKVFVIVGLLRKIGKTFYNGKLTDKDIQHIMKEKIQEKFDIFLDEQIIKSCQSNTENANSLILSENQLHYNQNNNLNGSQKRKEIIRKIVRELRNQKEFYKFIQDLSYEFKSRNTSTDQESYESKLEFDQSNFLSRSNDINENEQGRMRKLSGQININPQIQRNIIISSPLKTSQSLLFSSNSNFCSFPSNTILQSFTGFKPSIDIKGK